MNEEVARRVAAALGESEARAVSQIQRLLEVLGEDGVQAVLAETEHVEAGGGMLVPDGSRRRTPGGVFFQIARSKLTGKQRAFVFFTGERAPKVEAVAGESEVETPPAAPTPPPPVRRKVATPGPAARVTPRIEPRAAAAAVEVVVLRRGTAENDVQTSRGLGARSSDTDDAASAEDLAPRRRRIVPFRGETEAEAPSAAPVEETPARVPPARPAPIATPARPAPQGTRVARPAPVVRISEPPAGRERDDVESYLETLAPTSEPVLEIDLSEFEAELAELVAKLVRDLIPLVRRKLVEGASSVIVRPRASRARA